MLEKYNEIPIFIPLEITEDVVQSVTQKLSGCSGPGVMDSEALQGRLLKFGEDIKTLRSSDETFVYWISNNRPPWASYHTFMFGRLITLDKKPDICPVGV